MVVWFFPSSVMCHVPDSEHSSTAGSLFECGVGNARAELGVQIPQRGFEAGQGRSGSANTVWREGVVAGGNVRVQWSVLEPSKSDPSELLEHSSEVSVSSPGSWGKCQPS